MASKLLSSTGYLLQDLRTRLVGPLYVQYRGAKKSAGKDKKMAAKKVAPPSVVDPAISRVCTGLNYYNTGEDPPIRDDNQYPEWLWSILDPVKSSVDDKIYWRKLNKQKARDNNRKQLDTMSSRKAQLNKKLKTALLKYDPNYCTLRTTKTRKLLMELKALRAKKKKHHISHSEIKQCSDQTNLKQTLKAKLQANILVPKQRQEPKTELKSKQHEPIPGNATAKLIKHKQHQYLPILGETSPTQILSTTRFDSVFVNSLSGSLHSEQRNHRALKQTKDDGNYSQRKKNRTGQRTRRKQLELIYGNKANHIVMEKISGRKKGKVLHPSWEASKRRSTIPSFQGQRTVFPDSD